MGKNIAVLQDEDRRLVILRLLIEVGGSANESVLKDGLEQLGDFAGLTRGTVREHMHFLADRGLIKLTWFGDKVAAAKITVRGVKIAEGRDTVEGVKKPAIGE